MPAIRIRVGASVDGNAADVFTPYVDAAKKARARINDELGRVQVSARAIGPAARSGASAADKAMVALERSVSGTSTSLERSTAVVRTFGKEAQTSFAVARKSFDDLARKADRDLRQMERGLRRVGDANDNGISRRGLQSAARVVGRIGMGSLNASVRVGGDIVRGMGVNTDLSTAVASNVDLERRAVDLSNAGFMSGEAGANGRRQDAGVLAAEARRVGTETAFDPTKAMEGLQKFVGKTGDLETGRAVFRDLAVLSKATATDLEDMVDAAGDVSNALGNIPNKADVVSSVMRSIAGQGKLGAVEIKDMASQMAKLAANAGQIEGNTAGNIALLGAFAQEARQRGGASSATMAATSVASFMNTLKTPARADAFRAATGKSVFTKEGLIRNPQEIVMEALRAKGLDVEGFKDIFKNVQGARAVEGFATIYRQAGGGASGEAAVEAEFARLKQIAMAQGEIAESFKAAMGTGAAKAQVFNNEMSAIVAELQSAALPALQALAPLFRDTAAAVAKLLRLLNPPTEGKEEVEGRLSAINAIGDLNADVRAPLGGLGPNGQFSMLGSGVDEGHLEHARETQASLKKAMADKEKQVADERASIRQKYGDVGEDSIKQIAEGGVFGPNIEATNFLRHQSELQSMKVDSDDLAKAVQRALKETTLDVRVTNPAALTPPKRGGSAPPAAPMEAETGS